MPREFAYPTIRELIREPDEYMAQTRFYGLFLGEVIDVETAASENGRSDLLRGRVKVRVFRLHGKDAKAANLPWAELVQSRAGVGFGSFWVPKIGDRVAVEFEQGRLSSPNVVGSWYSAPDGVNSVPSEFTSDPNYPNRQGIKSPRGHIIALSDGDLAQPGTSSNVEITIKTAGGREVTIVDSDTGKGITIKSGDFELNLDEVVEAATLKSARGSVTIDDNANKITLTMPGEVQINAPTVKITGNLTVAGTVTDILGSLTTHVHSGVTTGPGTSGPRVPA